MNSNQIKEYYTAVHRINLSRNPEDEVAPVIDPGSSRLANTLVDFAHRMGMKRALGYLGTHGKLVAGVQVLDLGCGRGRWVVEYASRGATVTGVDISPDAINWLSSRMPSHNFICAAIDKLALPNERFDVVNCVTVLQHMPEEEQRAALIAVGKCLKIGGYLVMLENTKDYSSTHVFPHTSNEWVGMVEEAGLTFCHAWGSNFEQPLRAIARIRKRFLSRAKTGTPPDGAAWPPLTRTGMRLVKSITKDLAALVSFPVEWICQYLPIARPSHTVMIFEKR